MTALAMVAEGSHGVGDDARAIDAALQKLTSHGLALATGQESVRREQFLDELYLLCVRGHDQHALQRLLADLESDLRSGEYRRVDRILADLDVTRVAPSVLVGALTISFFAKDRLKERQAFLARAEASLRRLLGDQRAEALLATRR